MRNVTTAEIFQFKQHVLHGELLHYELNAGMRTASFEYLGRQGGEVQPLGARQKRHMFKCVIMGDDATQRLRELLASCEQEPRGPLTHPRLGRQQVCFETLRATETPANAIDEIDFTISFLEDQVDAELAVQKRTPQSAAAELEGAANDLREQVLAKFDQVNAITGLVVTAVNALVATVSSYVFQALEAVGDTWEVPSLERALGRVVDRRNQVLAALTDSLAQTLESDVSLTPYRQATYRVHAEAIELYLAVLAQKPALIYYPVPGPCTLMQVAVSLYGAEARARIDELRLLNPFLPYYRLPADTLLRVSAPVVIQ